ncbi:MAG: efflux RND transporter periplasmic adaptor subunit [Bryobacteraceae bacterium]|jgi:hypothetical protein
MKKAIFRIVGLAVLAGAVYGGYRYAKQGPQRASAIATAKVQRGDVVIRAYTRGELRTVRTFPLYAPPLVGTIQVTQLAPMGSYAKEKDLIVDYDDSELLASIDGDNLNVQSADESIKQQQLNWEVHKSQDAVTLLTAQYAVRRAQLNVQQNDVLDRISALNNLLQLEQSQRALDQTKINLDMHNKQAEAQLAIYASNRARSTRELQLDLVRLQQIKTLAPLSGLIAVKQNRGGNFNMGQQMPDIRTGDTLQSGMNVADILDLSEMELSAKVGELDRANLKVEQPVMIQLDAIPGKRFPGTIKSLSGTAISDVFSGDPSKKFDVVFAVDMRALLTGIGMKEAQVNEIMNTAAENARKNLISFAPDLGGRGGRGGGGGGDIGSPGGGPPGAESAILAGFSGMAAGGQQGGPGGGQGGGGRQRGQGGDQAEQGGRRGGFGGNLSDEDRQKMTQLRQQLQNAAGADRDKLQQQLQELMQQAGMGRGRGGDNAGGQGQGRQGRGQGASGGDNAGGGGRGQGGQPRGSAPVFTDEDRANAKLPLPPDQDSAVTVLLRPGLLADVEVEIEKIPDALHVPVQAVFRKNGMPTVYVQGKDGKFQAREVRFIKQSESTVVISGGVQPGELVALADPTQQNKENKGQSTEEKKSSTDAMKGLGGK